ncbi:hypothetical protein BDV26DRAFT_259036 [Aspergillus bertholletiae]|uniref:Uncharacterized protein n=1 Tax=Aspergillus bertholletiae TaxID=1226010 RepID=A0A5N7BCQ4_9EURO|nr:hypothetical protein BDV26DRAFT_259036 [Aspergillus bertholletiae]
MRKRRKRRRRRKEAKGSGESKKEKKVNRRIVLDTLVSKPIAVGIVLIKMRLPPKRSHCTSQHTIMIPSINTNSGSNKVRRRPAPPKAFLYNKGVEKRIL